MTPEEVVADFQRRYQETYIFVQEPDSTEENLFFVRMIEQNKEKLGIVHLHSDVIGGIQLNLASSHTLKFKPAPVGVFQHGADALSCLRIPQRQYRRGICRENTAIRSVVSGILSTGIDLTWATVQAAFVGKTSTFQEALEMLPTMKYRSVALDNGYSLALSPVAGSNDYILLYHANPIARVSKEGKVTVVGDAIFTPQIEQIVSQLKPVVETKEVVYG